MRGVVVFAAAVLVIASACVDPALQYRHAGVGPVVAPRTVVAESQLSPSRRQVCITNRDSLPAEGLSVLAMIQTKDSRGRFTDYVASPVDVSARPSLAAGESHCYAFDVTITPAGDAEYRTTVWVGVGTPRKELAKADVETGTR